MNYLSICSGIEAATVAWHPLGWEPAAFSEIEPFPSAVLAHHWPDVPNLGDMTQHHEWPSDLQPDIIVGGCPCQSFSVAGLRRGMADPRGNLTLTFLAIVEQYRPEWVVYENVPGILSDKTKALDSLLDGLEEIGYYVAGIDILDAQWFGVPQKRRRVFVLARQVSDLLKLKTPTCRLTVIQCLAEILQDTLGVLCGQLNQDAGNSGSQNGKQKDSLKKKIKQFGLGKPTGKQVSKLLENLVASLPSSECEQDAWGLDLGGSNRQIAKDTKSDTASAGSMGKIDGCQNIEPSWRSILEDALIAANECITSIASNQTIELRICSCARVMPFITNYILNSIPSCENFWSAASSCSTTLKEFTKYARLTSSDLFGDTGRIHWWDDFAKQALQANDAILGVGIECPGEILPLSESLRGDPPPCREARKVAPTIPSRSSAGGGLGTDFDCDGGLIPSVAHSLRGEGFDASEDGTGRGTPLVPVHTTGAGFWQEGFGTLRAREQDSHENLVAFSGRSRGDDGRGYDRPPQVFEDGKVGTLDTVKPHCVAFSCKDHGGDAGDSAPTLRSMNHDASHANGGGQVAVAFANTAGATNLGLSDTGEAPPITTRNGDPGNVAIGGKVRRLTPVECERLQGFPDGHTLIPGRHRLRKPDDLAEAIANLIGLGWTETEATRLANASDGPRYKALGNSMAVPVMRWIGRRIQSLETPTP